MPRTASLSRTERFPQSETRRLLLVDDEPLVRRLFVNVLKAAGYDVTDAGDGREAERILDRSNCFDLAITDLVNPEREGLETIRAMRRICPKMKILAISGAFDGRFLPIASALGADATLAKPITPVQLVDSVRGMLD